MVPNIKTTRDWFMYFRNVEKTIFPPRLPFGWVVCGVSGVEWYDVEAGLYACEVFRPNCEQSLIPEYQSDFKKIFEMFQDVNAVSLWLKLSSGVVVDSGFIPIESLVSPAFSVGIQKIKSSWF